jgi:uncharacterized repeat protein (TIGR03803 family)
MNQDQQTLRTRRTAWYLGTLLLSPLAAAAQGSAPVMAPSFVHSFAGWPDGILPFGGLTLGADGALYGTTTEGGIYGPDYTDGSNGNGTVFRIGADRSYSVLYSFTHVEVSNNYSGIANVDGRSPETPLSVAADGTLYGVTPYGGSADSGVVFKYSAGTGFTALYYFSGSQPGDPLDQTPIGGLTLGSAGRLFGSTEFGGSEPSRDGMVFSMAEDGTDMQTLQSFGGSGLVMRPASQLLLASDGQLYGVARPMQYIDTLGGALYRIAQDGSGFAVLHRFMTATEGDFSGDTAPSVVEGNDGYLYGATSAGGPGAGALYRVAKDGSGFTILHRFAALGGGNVNAGGGTVSTRLIVGADGLLYGAAQYGGYAGNGVVFRLAADGSGFTVLYSFPSVGGNKGNGVGANPTGNITFNGDGELCGTAKRGGTSTYGTAWCLKAN